MLLIRRFEERTEEQYTRARIGGYCHLAIGEEAANVGAIDPMEPGDYVLASYRDHGTALAVGSEPHRVMAELFGKATGVAGGYGGSMHLLDVERHFLGGWGIVGGQLPIAVGVALALDYESKPNAVLCQLGEGATNIGAFHESLNLAAIWNLPIVFQVINNRYGMGTSVEMASAEPEQWKRAAAYRMHGERVDGNDLLAVREAADRLLRRARDERRPALLETTTYRFRGHSVADAGKVYRAAEEVAEAKKHDPIDRFVAQHGDRRRDRRAPAQRGQRRDRRRHPPGRRRSRARSGRPLRQRLRRSGLARAVLAHGARRAVRRAGGDARMAGVTYREALRRALDEELARDDKVFLMGEEIGRFEGSYKVTAGLYAKYGPRRVRETPIAEEGFVGAGVGAAMLGLRPVVEIMTINFILVAMDMVVNHAAKVRQMFGGKVGVPLVIRTPAGAGAQLTAQHSQSLEVMFAHTPGLKVVAPSTPLDAYGLLKSAIRDDDPVLFVENLVLYNVNGALPEPGDDFTVPIGRAQVVREGRDLTIVAHSYTVRRALTVADRLSQHGIEVEVVDLRSLRPLDAETVCRRASRRRRARSSPRRAGRPTASGAELAARISRECFDDLDAPVERVGGAEAPMPYAKPLELAALTLEDKIEKAARGLLAECGLLAEA